MAFRTNLNRSKSVTINEPNAIDPRDRVDARTNADMVGCFGCQEWLRDKIDIKGRTSDHISKITGTKVIPGAIGTPSECR